MRRSSQNQPTEMGTLSELNITPLLDLAFVLLIIFMITAPFLAESADLIIPTSRASREAVREDQVTTVSITRTQQIYLGKELVTMSQLKSRLGQSFRSDPEMAVLIKADRKLTVEDLVSVMDVAKNVGISKVGVMTKAGENS
tara:strand:+ start:3194 stop:3619 length:426 start_codon:yes stop_codon:yes gene_type:complete